MTPKDFFIVDVFAEKKYQGNQLAVVIDAGNLGKEEMQSIAGEFNFSETTFIIPEKSKIDDQVFRVRIFTPASEVPFAGHPTLGTAYIIYKEILKNEVSKITLDLDIGKIPVTFSHDKDTDNALWMIQQTPQFMNTFDPAGIAEIIGVGADEIDIRYPVQEISTGLNTIIIPLRTLESVRKCVVDVSRCKSLMERIGPKLLLVFAPETYENNDLNTRVFAHAFNISEDPATGSGNGCLAAYLIQYCYFNTTEINVRVEQGYEINRASLIRLRAKKNNTTIEVRVGGRVIITAKGQLF